MKTSSKTTTISNAVAEEPQHNYVKLSPDGYMEVILAGDQTPETVERVAKEGAELAKKMPGGAKMGRQLVDISRSGSYSSESNKAAMKVIDLFPYQRVAIHGGSHLLNDVINMVIMLMGKGNKIKTFNTREEALEWLLAPMPSLGDIKDND